MNNELQNFQKAYKKLCEKLNIEVKGDHPFLEVMYELEGAVEVHDEKNRASRMEQMRQEKAQYYIKRSNLRKSKNESDPRAIQKRRQALKEKEKEFAFDVSRRI